MATTTHPASPPSRPPRPTPADHHRHGRLDPARRPGLGAALVSEWTKLTSLRSTIWSLLAMVALTPAFAVVVAVTRSLGPGDTIVASSLMGVTTAQVFAAIVGVLAMSSEYTSGSIRAILAAVPRRGTVLLAKAAVVVAVLFVLALASGLAAHRIGVLLSDGPYPAGNPPPVLH